METPTQKLRVEPERLERIEELAQQWALLDEHYTQYNLNRREQLQQGQKIYRSLMAELQQAYRTREPAHA